MNFLKTSKIVPALFSALFALLLTSGVSVHSHASTVNNQVKITLQSKQKKANRTKRPLRIAFHAHKHVAKAKAKPVQNNAYSVHAKKTRIKAVQAQPKQQTKPKAQKQGNWYRDGLNNQNYNARAWVSWHESNNRWNVESYSGSIGRYQLSPGYLGYKNGHVNLNHQHQVKVADRYAQNRYGSWVNAKGFWQAHHWY